MRDDEQTPEGFDREGHLSPLTIERILAGELAHEGPVGAHIEGCDDCRGALDSGRRFDTERRFAPPQTARRAAGSTAAGPGRLAVGAILAMAAAAMVFFAIDRAPPDETTPAIRIKGGFDLEIFGRLGADGTQRAIDDGDTVHAGEQIAFRARAQEVGHLLILGVDGRGETYPVHPPGAAPTAAPLPKTAEPVPLDGAIEFDAAPGTETLVALLCPAPVTYIAVAPALAKRANDAARGDTLPALREGCHQRVVRLTKAP